MDFALGVLVFVVSLAGGEPRDGGHVRTMDVRLRAGINEGMARSSSFRDLVARLDGSDVIVYVEPECPMSQRLFGRLTFMAASGGRRYVNVRIACGLNPDEQIAALGHELRHAVEIADAPSVVDVASLGELYRRIGFASHGVPHGLGFESRAAIDTARRVWIQLGRAAE
ncbi:MAG TPA: hypothetical protein VN654_19110 [Vicinamibacterales bacterium]|jgi:hypothetical protein|nr:hypothetical protein [Vicinamibacterales bacterium]